MNKGIFKLAGKESTQATTLENYFPLHYLSSTQHIIEAICSGESFLKVFNLERLV